MSLKSRVRTLEQQQRAAEALDIASHKPLVTDASGVMHLPPDATPSQRRIFEQMRGMLWSILPPSIVTTEFFVED
jgi:hypothetical protein